MGIRPIDRWLVMSIACCLCFMVQLAFAQPPKVAKSKGVSISGVVSGALDASPQDKLDKLAQEANKTSIASLYIHGKIRYTKMDASGALVSIKSKNSSFTATTKTDQEGKFKFDSLVDGIYEILAEKEFVRDGQVINAKGRALGGLQELDFVDIRLHTDIVTLKGKVINTEGKPIGGVRLVATQCVYADTSEIDHAYPPQYATTLLDGTYELQNLVAPGFERVAQYLMYPKSIADDQGDANKPFSTQIIIPGPFTNNFFSTIPLITEEAAVFARRYMSIMNKLYPPEKKYKGWVEKEGIVLPKSKGNVIFVPDIIKQ